MKFLATFGVVAVIAVSAVAIYAGVMAFTAGAITKPGTIAVTATLSRTGPVAAGELGQYLVYNRRLTTRPIGNAQLICSPLPPLGRTVRYCWGQYLIGSSTIVVHGVVRNPFRWKVAIVGGTGLYNNVGGSLESIRYTNRPVREYLTFRLTYP